MVCAGLTAGSILLSKSEGDENKLEEEEEEEEEGLVWALSPEEAEGPAVELLAVVPGYTVLGWVLCPEPSSAPEALVDFLCSGAVANKQTIKLCRTYLDLLLPQHSGKS